MTLPFPVESWIWYSLNIAIICCRFAARYPHLKANRKFHIDDILMVVIVLTETVFMVIINKEIHYNSNLIAPGTDVAALTSEDIHERVIGSKLTLVLEQMQCCTVWLLKACLLALYLRVTVGFRIHYYVKALAIYVGASFVIMEVLYFGVWCRPFQAYWAVPTPDIQCATALHHLITNAVFNLSSDVCMLTLAFILFINNSLSWSRKIILCCVFGLGLFTILSAVLNKYYSFKHPFGSEWPYWYVRESSTAILVANLPFTWALLRRIFNLGSFVNTADIDTIRLTNDHLPDKSPRKSRTLRCLAINPSRLTFDSDRYAVTPNCHNLSKVPHDDRNSNVSFPLSPRFAPPPSPTSPNHRGHNSFRDSNGQFKRLRDAGVYGILEADISSDMNDDDEINVAPLSVPRRHSKLIKELCEKKSKKEGGNIDV